MIFQNKQKKAASTSTSAATASSEAATASTAASTTALVASTSTTTAQSTSSLDPTSERQKEGLLLPGNQLSLSQSNMYSFIHKRILEKKRNTSHLGHTFFRKSGKLSGPD